MTKVVSFTGKSNKRKASTTNDTPSTFTEAIEQDINRLCEALGVDRDKAIAIASDFYMKYPMLIEYVRSSDFMLRK